MIFLIRTIRKILKAVTKGSQSFVRLLTLVSLTRTMRTINNCDVAAVLNIKETTNIKSLMTLWHPNGLRCLTLSQQQQVSNLYFTAVVQYHGSTHSIFIKAFCSLKGYSISDKFKILYSQDILNLKNYTPLAKKLFIFNINTYF